MCTGIAVMIKHFPMQVYSFPRARLIKYFLTLKEILLSGTKSMYFKNKSAHLENLANMSCKVS